MSWKITKAEEHWVDLESDVGAKCGAKWDGCLHLTDEDGTYLHICDIDTYINDLQELKAKIIEAFGPEWPW